MVRYGGGVANYSEGAVMRRRELGVESSGEGTRMRMRGGVATYGEIAVMRGRG